MLKMKEEIKPLEEIEEKEELAKIGRELANKEQYKEAIEYLEKALQKDPKDIQILNSLGFANGRSGKYEKAKEWYKKALEIEPKFQKALGNIGHVLEMEGNYEEAIKNYEKALSIEVEDENLKFPKNVIKVVEEHLQKAKDKLQQK